MHLKLKKQLGAIGLVLMATPVAYAQAFPSKPIQLIVGYGAGGGTDMCFRNLAKTAGEILGQNIVVENKPGAGSSLSIGYIARQKPDGYTIAALSTGALLNQFLNEQITYDVMKDLEPIAMVAQYQVGLLVRADSPMKTLEDIIAFTKEKGEVAYSTAGVGTPQHLTMARLGQQVGANWVHTPYKSGPETVMALMRGDVDVMAQTAEWVPNVRDGRLRLINVFTEQRMKGFDYAPTLVEQGYQLVAPSLLGVVGPKGMDPKVVQTLQEAFHQAMQTDDFDACTDQFGLKADYKNAADFTQYLSDTATEWGPITKALRD